jgi:hypothetical protein
VGLENTFQNCKVSEDKSDIVIHGVDAYGSVLKSSMKRKEFGKKKKMRYYTTVLKD